MLHSNSKLAIHWRERRYSPLQSEQMYDEGRRAVILMSVGRLGPDILYTIVSEQQEVYASDQADMTRYSEEKEAKKEAFKKYLESSGVRDALTKVLVTLYEQNEKPSSAVEFIQRKLGGPSSSQHEKLQAELTDLQMKHRALVILHEQTCIELEKLRKAKHGTCAMDSTSREDFDGTELNHSRDEQF